MSLFACAPEPLVDPAAIGTDLKLLELAYAFRDAGADCRNRLGRARDEILRGPQAPGATAAGV